MAISKAARRRTATRRAHGTSNGAANGARDDILNAARKLFASKGYRATSVQDLADELGYGKASLYHYVRRKDDLLYAIHDLYMRRLTDDLEAILAGEGRPADKLRDVIVRFVELLAKNHDEATVVNDEMRELSPRNLKRVIASRDEYERSLTRLVTEGMKAREFQASDARVCARAILGMTNWCYRWLKADGPLPPRVIGQQMADLVLDGIAAAPTRASR